MAGRDRDRVTTTLIIQCESFGRDPTVLLRDSVQITLDQEVFIEFIRLEQLVLHKHIRDSLLLVQRLESNFGDSEVR